MRVSRRALMAVARADAAAADHATGRWVATANATVARLTGLCERTVQYARATLVHLGLCRVVATGRYLTADERRTAARTHGGRQMRAASTRVLTMSCAIVCALPRRGHHYRKVKFLDGHQRTRRRVRRPATPEKKPLWLQKLAALLDAMNRRNRRLGLDVPCADDQKCHPGGRNRCGGCGGRAQPSASQRQSSDDRIHPDPIRAGVDR